MSLRVSHSQEEGQTRARNLLSVFQGLQHEYLELTSLLPRPPTILAEPPGSLIMLLESLNSALIIMHDGDKNAASTSTNTKGTAAAITVRQRTGGNRRDREGLHTPAAAPGHRSAPVATFEVSELPRLGY